METTLYQHYTNVVQRCFDVVSTSGTDVVSALCDVENPTSDQRYFNVDSQRWNNVDPTLKCWLGLDSLYCSNKNEKWLKQHQSHLHKENTPYNQSFLLFYVFPVRPPQKCQVQAKIPTVRSVFPDYLSLSHDMTMLQPTITLAYYNQAINAGSTHLHTVSGANDATILIINTISCYSKQWLVPKLLRNLFCSNSRKFLNHSFQQ